MRFDRVVLAALALMFLDPGVSTAGATPASGTAPGTACRQRGFVSCGAAAARAAAECGPQKRVQTQPRTQPHGPAKTAPTPPPRRSN